MVSGGRSSAKMARHIQICRKYRKYKKLYVFCNTGQERPETIQFLKDMVNSWKINLHLIEGVYSDLPGVGVKHRLVEFDTMDMKSRVFSDCIRHLQKNKWTGVPNQATPYCSEYMKVRPAHSFAKEVFGTVDYIKAIGFRKEDMPKRISWAEIKEEKRKIFPLITDFKNPVSQFDLNRWFKIKRFRLYLHSKLGNCKYCYKKSEPNLLEAIKIDIKNGELHTVEWYRSEENKYGNMFFRNNLSIDDLVKMASDPFVQLAFAFADYEDDYNCVCSF